MVSSCSPWLIFLFSLQLWCRVKIETLAFILVVHTKLVTFGVIADNRTLHENANVVIHLVHNTNHSFSAKGN